jgi:hypothetical protein
MPYYRCPACGVTVHSTAAYATARVCPNCSAAIGAGARVDVTPDASVGTPAPRADARALAMRHALERQATDTPARRGLERDISNLLQEIDALEGQAATCAPSEREDLAERQTAVAERLAATIGALRALATRHRAGA